MTTKTKLTGPEMIEQSVKRLYILVGIQGVAIIFLGLSSLIYNNRISNNHEQSQINTVKIATEYLVRQDILTEVAKSTESNFEVRIKNLEDLYND